jgi:hypothetical protein
MIFSESAMSTEGVQLLGARTESIGRRRRRDERYNPSEYLKRMECWNESIRQPRDNYLVH